MLRYLEKAISFSFYLLFLAVPLILFPKTSEIFEFNKMVTVYFLTVVISCLWLIKIIIRGKIIFRRTLLDIPLIVFLLSQLLSTLFSVDTRTSFFGYYSRFNGGFLSTLSYSLLYWAYISNMDSQKTKKSLFVLFTSTFISCIWAIFEHYGHSFSCLIFPGFNTFDVSCWVQDVKTRVYSTFGQPNWLAAWLTAIIPLTWAFILNNRSREEQNPKSKPVNQSETDFKFQIPDRKQSMFMILSFILLVTLLFTKSRSGILAFAVSYVIFFGFYLVKNIKRFKSELHPYIYISGLIVIAVLFAGTPWTPNLKQIFTSGSNNTSYQQPAEVTGPALETGGTESGKIRQIVWRGAIEIWKHFPVFGSGVETFAYSYYQFRPIDHNYVSEWDYLYNKAHNEYLNFAATTGSFGLISYFVLIIGIIGVILNEKRWLYLLVIFLIPVAGIVIWCIKRINKPKSEDDSTTFRIAFLSGFFSIVVTNFFGFSVVPVSLLFFIFPALATTLDGVNNEDDLPDKKINNSQKIYIGVLLLFTFYILSAISRYWYADYTYAKGRYENDAGDHENALKTLSTLVEMSPKEPVYWNELADSSTYIALDLKENKNSPELAKSLADATVIESKTAISLSPANVNLKRSYATRLENLTGIDPSYLLTSIAILKEARDQAPTDAKLEYQLSVNYLRTGDYQSSIKEMLKTVSLKSDYEKARYALALMYIDTGELLKAKEQLEYILEKINPVNKEAEKELNEINSKLP